jgi:CRP-like cAMP-binding protein
MNPELIQFLSNFQMLTKEEVLIIAEHTHVKEFKKGLILLKEGEVCKSCYSVLKGCVREYIIKDGEEKTTAFFTEGDAIASFTSSTTKKPSKHFLECTEDSLLTVSNQDLESKICKLIPRLESIIRFEVEKNAGKEHDHLSKFISSSPEERYLDFQENRPELFNRIPQHQIASYLGIKPESLSRIRKRLSLKK